MISVEYKSPGLLTVRPDGKGWWEFRSVKKLIYKGKPIGILGGAYGLGVKKSGERMYSACITPVVIYDEDGDGRFESVKDLPANGAIHFMFPSGHFVRLA